MPPRRAQLGGMFGSGVQPRERPHTDLTPAIDAALAGVSTVIQNAYLRKRTALEDKRQATLDQQAQQRWQADYDLRKDAAARETQAAAEDRSRKEASDFTGGLRTPDQVRDEIATNGPARAAAAIPQLKIPQMGPPAPLFGDAAPAPATPPLLRLPESMQRRAQPPAPHHYVPLSGGEYLDQDETPDAKAKREHDSQLDEAAYHIEEMGLTYNGHWLTAPVVKAFENAHPGFIDSLIKAQGTSTGFNLSPGQTHFGPDGKPTASVPAAEGSAQMVWITDPSDPTGQREIGQAFDPKTRSMQPVPGAVRTGQAAPPRVPQAIVQATASNRAQLSTLDKAITLVNSHPTAFGLKRGLSDELDQRIDPDGVGARAAVADIGSLVIHDRSGAAVTVNEFPRLKPFVPRIQDTPEAIVTKLSRMQAILKETNTFLENAVPTSGAVGANETGLSDADLWEEKVDAGMSAAQATEYVQHRRR